MEKREHAFECSRAFLDIAVIGARRFNMHGAGRGSVVHAVAPIVTPGPIMASTPIME